ncbi:hypothetical protein TorRG33x02_346720, partial [Trema orientale]
MVTHPIPIEIRILLAVAAAKQPARNYRGKFASNNPTLHYQPSACSVHRTC